VFSRKSIQKNLGFFAMKFPFRAPLNVNKIMTVLGDVVTLIRTKRMPSTLLL
jgi:hypothetical protein